MIPSQDNFLYSGRKWSINTVSLNQDIYVSSIAFLQRSIHQEAFCTTEAVVEQGVQGWIHRHRVSYTHQQSKHMPEGAHIQGWHFSAWHFCKNLLTRSYFTNYKFSVFYFLNFELSKKNWCIVQASVSKNQNRKGGQPKICLLGWQKTQSMVQSTHHTTGLCKHQLQLYCGCTSISEVACLPVIIACVLKNNNKTRKWKWRTDCGWRSSWRKGYILATRTS
jgi:hypothetical protein